MVMQWFVTLIFDLTPLKCKYFAPSLCLENNYTLLRLLILDEPTVGVDPVLRAKLWKHLLELVKTDDVTILITTHYIEEARQVSARIVYTLHNLGGILTHPLPQADIVGLMRDGALLAEAAPDELMARYHKNTLEDVFLELCRRQPLNEDANKCVLYRCERV